MDTEQRFKNTNTSRIFKRIIRFFAMDKKAVFDLGCGFGEHLSLFGEGSVGITSNMHEVEVGKGRGLDIVFARRNDSFIYGEKKLQEWKGALYYDSLLKSTKQSL